VEGLENGTVVVKLGKRRVQGYEEAVVDAGMANIVTNSSD
jgi:hypothetical protein